MDRLQGKKKFEGGRDSLSAFLHLHFPVTREERREDGIGHYPSASARSG
jgi:hypothetical protein